MSLHSRIGLSSAALWAAFALSACETPAGDVSVLQSDSRALTPGSTYAWAQASTPAPNADPRIANDIIQERLHRAVDTALAAKGYRLTADPQQAELLVSYHVSLEDRTEASVTTLGAAGPTYCGIRGCIGGWGAYGPPMTTVDTFDYTQGTLVLDIVDRASGKLAWRATSRKQVNEGDGAQAPLNAMLADMTKTLPGTAP
ncbi:DUF4136 domain-containing protein [Phenylobacterium terrae]|uniref:DUF4136 domain-containing protein n=1 Tax=Phenylobacterium terrae TaxID=2665495 RepID=A0ABW4N2M8_9CAUL